MSAQTLVAWVVARSSPKCATLRGSSFHGRYRVCHRTPIPCTTVPRQRLKTAYSESTNSKCAVTGSGNVIREASASSVVFHQSSPILTGSTLLGNVARRSALGMAREVGPDQHFCARSLATVSMVSFLPQHCYSGSNTVRLHVSSTPPMFSNSVAGNRQSSSLTFYSTSSLSPPHICVARFSSVAQESLAPQANLFLVAVKVAGSVILAVFGVYVLYLLHYYDYSVGKTELHLATKYITWVYGKDKPKDAVSNTQFSTSLGTDMEREIAMFFIQLDHDKENGVRRSDALDFIREELVVDVASSQVCTAFIKRGRGRMQEDKLLSGCSLQEFAELIESVVLESEGREALQTDVEWQLKGEANGTGLSEKARARRQGTSSTSKDETRNGDIGPTDGEVRSPRTKLEGLGSTPEGVTGSSETSPAAIGDDQSGSTATAVSDADGQVKKSLRTRAYESLKARNEVIHAQQRADASLSLTHPVHLHDYVVPKLSSPDASGGPSASETQAVCPRAAGTLSPSPAVQMATGLRQNAGLLQQTPPLDSHEREQEASDEEVIEVAIERLSKLRGQLLKLRERRGSLSEAEEARLGEVEDMLRRENAERKTMQQRRKLDFIQLSLKKT